MAQTLEQQIADTEARLARLRQQGRKLENGQKIILGSVLLNAARHDPKMRKWLLSETAKAVTRDVDKRRLQPLLDELRKMPSEQ